MWLGMLAQLPDELQWAQRPMRGLRYRLKLLVRNVYPWVLENGSGHRMRIAPSHPPSQAHRKIFELGETIPFLCPEIAVVRMVEVQEKYARLKGNKPSRTLALLQVEHEPQCSHVRWQERSTLQLLHSLAVHFISFLQNLIVYIALP
jgi:hypothetical protein